VNSIKTGFYHIAKRTGIPIIMISFDAGSKTIKVCDPFYPSDNVTADFKKIITFFSSNRGIKAENGVSPDMYEHMLPELNKMQSICDAASS